MWNLLKINEFCRDEMQMIKYLIKMGILSNNKICKNCKSDMELKKIADCWHWRCRKVRVINFRKVQCNSKQSIRKEIFFSNSNLPIQKILQLLYMMDKNYEQIQIINEIQLNKNTVSQWMDFIKQVMEERAISSSE